MRYLGLLLVLLGCSANRVPFEPLQRATAFSSEGLQAATYELIPQPSRWGAARVSSRGLYRIDAADTKQWVAHVRLEVDNTGGEPIRFSASDAALEIVTEAGVSKVEAERDSDQGALIAVGASRSFDLFYDLPAAIEPQGVQSFTAVWALDGANRYSQRTEFRRLVRRGPGRSYCDNRPFDDFCDPFFYGFSLYVHSYDFDDHPAAPDGGTSGAGSAGGSSPSPSSFPKPRSRAD